MAKEKTEVPGLVDPFDELELIDLARRREALGRMTIGQLRKAHEERYAAITIPEVQRLPHGEDGKILEY